MKARNVLQQRKLVLLVTLLAALTMIVSACATPAAPADTPAEDTGGEAMAEDAVEAGALEIFLID